MESEFTLKLEVPVGNLTLAMRTIQVNSGQTIRALRNDIQDMNGIPCEQQLLLYSKNILDDSKTIEFYDIQDEHKIQLIRRLPGKLPAIFHRNGQQVTLHLLLKDTAFKIKQLLTSKGFPGVANLMLGSSQIDDNATVEGARLTPFCSVYCT